MRLILGFAIQSRFLILARTGLHICLYNCTCTTMTSAGSSKTCCYPTSISSYMILLSGPIWPNKSDVTWIRYDLISSNQMWSEERNAVEHYRWLIAFNLTCNSANWVRILGFQISHSCEIIKWPVHTDFLLSAWKYWRLSMLLHSTINGIHSIIRKRVILKIAPTV